MASNGVGIDVHLDRVPLREDGMEPWEIMISESQERMVAVVREQMLDSVRAVCDRWELPCTVIGEVTEGGQLRCLHGDDVVGDVPARFLTDEAPRYTVATRRREPVAAAPIWGPESHPQALIELLRSPNIRSKRWIYEQYDHLVGSRTVRRPGFDGAVLRLRSGNRGLAVSLDGQGRVCSLDPRTGGALAILESARNVACAGGTPLAFTDCLNFGNPEKPEQAWELAEAIEGMAEACEALGLPIVSGNVSLYNETDGRPIYPTPVVGCVGLVADVTRIPSTWQQGDIVILAGKPELSLDGSEYQALYGELAGRPAKLDLRSEATLITFLAKVSPHVSLLHDCAEGGLAVALAECAIASGIGAEVELPPDAQRLFGEVGGQAIVACDSTFADSLRGVPLRRLGVVGGDSICGVPLDELRGAWENR
jgi:phosphoribosylformylglycinamidine synthase